MARQLASYKNTEIEAPRSLNGYTLDCSNVTGEESHIQEMPGELAEMQNRGRDLQVKHDVLNQMIQFKQRKDEEWLFLGLLGDDKEFSNPRRARLPAIPNKTADASDHSVPA